jgi:hypothetical protein
MTLENNIFAASTFGTPLTLAADTAAEMIDNAERAGHWPVDVREASVVANDGGTMIKASRNVAIVGEYRDNSRRVLGINGRRYNATSPAQWRELVTAAVAAGAKPFGSHGWGGKVAAMFEVPSNHKSGIKSTLVLGDSFDGSSMLVGGGCAVRPFCANQLSAPVGSAKRSGGDWCKIAHTASLDEKVNRLAAGMVAVAEEGAAVSALFDRAALVHLPGAAARAAFDAFFPEAPEDASARAKTLAENRRAAARVAAALPCNRVGNAGNLATLWNASTYLVDRNEDGTARNTRGSAVGSMLFGSRGKRVEECLHLVEVILADGTVESMTVAQATDAGVDSSQLGKGLLEAMLADA